jgi:two-component system, LytTR family, sensor kinase
MRPESPTQSSGSTPPRPGGLRTLGWAAVVVTPLAWSTVAFIFIGMNAAGRELSFERALLAGLPDWYLWAVFAPLVFWLGNWFRLERDHWVGSIAAHLLAGTFLALALLFLVAVLNRSLAIPTFAGAFRDVYLRLILQYFHFHFIIYWVIVLAAHAFRYYNSFREREVETSRLRTELTQAQLSALQHQLHPHFFFNTLHTIATLVREGRASAATDMIARLGALFRRTLGNSSRSVVPLREEMEFLSAYLEIEQTRFSDRLEVRMDLAPNTLEGQVPSMALQPLVENAIRHVIARDPSARVVEVGTRRHSDTLVITIRNDGPSCAHASSASGTGVGLRNLRARLGRLYGSNFRLELKEDTPGGSRVELEIPWRTDPLYA